MNSDYHGFLYHIRNNRLLNRVRQQNDQCSQAPLVFSVLGDRIALDSREMLTARLQARALDLANLSSARVANHTSSHKKGVKLDLFGRLIVEFATRQSGSLSLVAIVIPPLVYLAFCLINFQGAPDLIPLFPFIGIFSGWFFVDAGRLLASRRFGKAGSSLNLAMVVPGLAIGVILLLLAARSITYRAEPGPTLQDQREKFQAISNVLGPDDRIYVHGTIEILVLLARPNLNPYIMFDEGKDDFVAARNYGGSFQAILDELGGAAPKIISFSRLRHVTHRAEFERWVLERYEELHVAGHDDIYVRKQ